MGVGKGAIGRRAPRLAGRGGDLKPATGVDDVVFDKETYAAYLYGCTEMRRELDAVLERILAAERELQTAAWLDSAQERRINALLERVRTGYHG